MIAHIYLLSIPFWKIFYLFFKGINEFIAASPDEIIQKVSFVDTYAYILPANVDVELIRELVKKYHEGGKRYNFGDLLDEAGIEHYREAWDAERWDRDCIVVFPNDNVEWAICETRDLEPVEARDINGPFFFNRANNEVMQLLC